METIKLHLMQRRETAQMTLHSTDLSLNPLIKQLSGIKWSKTHGYWYLPLNNENYKMLQAHIQGKALLNATLLKASLQQKKKDSSALPQGKPAVNNRAAEAASDLSEASSIALNRFVQQLTLKAYSPSTIRSYRNEFMQLLHLLKERSVSSLIAEDIKRYMAYVIGKQGISENTAHSRLNALKFYYEQVLGREKFFWEIPHPKKPIKLPKLLNENEIRNLFNALENKKHKAILFTVYSAGLRVSEVVNLKISDIDSQRMQIRIANAKGKKDRYVNLSPILLDILRKYLMEYRPSPRIYLFESEATFKAYPVRTIQRIFNNAREKAGILKQVGMHSLRHSFATHLLDKGTDIRYIKELLGHFNIKTTERYLHVTNKQLINIISPFDDLVSKGKIDW